MAKILDLFCGAGGAAMGYHRAGFEVVGVDWRPQPHFPFEFVQAAWNEVDYTGYDAIHASPPCQAYSTTRNFAGGSSEHPMLISEVREFLVSSGKPYMIENVVGARRDMIRPIVLCGQQMGLKVRRHRLFECSFFVEQPLYCRDWHTPRPVCVMGHHPEKEVTRARGKVNRASTLQEGSEAMGINWMPWHSLTQAIPPVYTEYIGRFLMAHLQEGK